jgi:nitroreductase
MTITLDKAAQTQVEIHELLSRRWSPRAFADKPITLETIQALLEAARWAPSSRNEQPWRFIVGSRDHQPQIHAQLAEVINENNRRWAANAPLLMLAVAKITYNDDPTKTNRFAWYDTGQAVAHLSIEATAQGLSLHQMGGFNPVLARETFNIPDDHEPVVTMAIGYRAALDTLPDDLRERELKPRSRRALDEMVFSDSWGESSPLMAKRD